MKSQDIVILLKLASLYRDEQRSLHGGAVQPPVFDWEGWEPDESDESERIIEAYADQYTARGLEASLGISKSEVNASLNRSLEVGMAMRERQSGLPRANIKALLEFIVHGLKYVFPARPGAMIRGIPTALAAPVLQGKVMSAGEYIYVWPDPRGKSMGQSLPPLFKSVPLAVKKDPDLYTYLALVDAIRLGSPREAGLAAKILAERLES